MRNSSIQDSFQRRPLRTPPFPLLSQLFHIIARFKDEMVSSTAEKYLWFLMDVKQPSGHRWKTPLFAVYNDLEMNPPLHGDRQQL
jgi:hypothetical protein